MSDTKPKARFYEQLSRKHPKMIAAVEALGDTVRSEGPLDGKTVHLIQLAAAAAIGSEGSVHSHTRRTLKAGASVDEIEHAVTCLVSTLGFPTVAAALSWVYDITEGR